jgi:O-methyltransferase involved in polyketide biosynthesis
MDQVLFVEVDHPDSQRWKRERLVSLGLETPGVHYVPVDFASQDLRKELASAGVDPGRPTFFAWLGVTEYLEEEASTNALRSAAVFHIARARVV